jgi:hypothetical protein
MIWRCHLKRIIHQQFGLSAASPAQGSAQTFTVLYASIPQPFSN